MKGWACWKACVVLVALSAALGLAACDLDDLVAAGVQSSSVQTAAFTTVGTPTVDVESANGAVSLRSVTGQEDVRVTATLRSRGATQSEADDRVSRMIVHMTQDGDRIVLSYVLSEQPLDIRKYSGVEFDVTLPQAADAVVDTSNGAVSVSGLSGIAQLETSNGQIAVDRFIGELLADTSNGQIVVSDSEAVFRLATSNGAIVMTNLEGLVDAKTSNGLISFSGRLADGASRMHTSNGRIRVEIPSSSAVALVAETSNEAISSDLPWIGDTTGRSWSATLNAPATANLSLSTSNGSIWIGARP